LNLGTLLDGIAKPERDATLSDITLNSRDVREGSVFLACRGARHHGLDFAADVAARGAAAILWEPEADRAPPALRSDIVVTRVPSLSEKASEIAGRFFGVPSRHLLVAGITGTNGKTTTAWLLAQALSACGRPAAYLGTLGSVFGGAHEAGEFTTPDAVSVQRRLAAFRAKGAACVAMEVSSHALAQARVAAVQFDAAIFTNLTRDHLDFHGDMSAYAAAKARLFAFESLRRRVINADDAFGAELLLRPDFEHAIATSRRADFAPRHGQSFLQAYDIKPSANGMRFQLRSSFGSSPVTSLLVGSFNVDNLLAVLGVLLGGGIAFDTAIAAVAGISAPPGRLETFGGGASPLAVVDYAHTPDALEKAIGVLRQHCSGRLWCVFGCGGDRDAGKRPEMGKIAAARADVLILTDDNPRSEDPAAIVRGILSGIAGQAPRVIHDRGAAITTAIAEASPGDTVLIAGKGHEEYQLVGNSRHAFSDARVVRMALAQRGAA
jgi:UDP-N-acetylmuramoyl-L-alanyl-D-glutamate--2,6-diaminopimelate ligase